MSPLRQNESHRQISDAGLPIDTSDNRISNSTGVVTSKKQGPFSSVVRLVQDGSDVPIMNDDELVALEQVCRFLDGTEPVAFEIRGKDGTALSDVRGDPAKIARF